MGSNVTETPVAIVNVPQAAGEAPAVSEIPMPPPALWAELDNSAQSSGSAKPSTGAPAAPAAALPAREVEKLAFSRSTATTVPLEFAFDHPELGHIASVIVRRLTVGQVGDILDRRSRTSAPDLYDIYAEMTQLPAPVLRGLEAGDGGRVVEVCWDFLPPVFRPTSTATGQ
ncbi:hypothetical protein [Pannonibacter sp. SL95]|uniref:hypothetical protein n=1 Tax=Pannonibacter sp. SL95 TaxID=2995153 RepID=UPI002276D0D1|nr:hypothetical protein [Pannonibacter sp. SL95]MCY1705254.1 hypothetical protein [Pannonibacter sp. SL95]